MLSSVMYSMHTVYRMLIPIFIVPAVLAEPVVLASLWFFINRQRWLVSALLKELR